MFKFLKRKKARQNEDQNKQIEKAFNLLGPFVGSITESSVKIWLHIPENAIEQLISVFVTLHEAPDSPRIERMKIDFAEKSMRTGIAEFSSLVSNMLYHYRIWLNEECTSPLDLQGLENKDLFFKTLPLNGFDKQLDFLLMSCHNPFTAEDDGHDGFAVWERMPEIIRKNDNVRFAILAGDQIYGDSVEVEMLSEHDAKKRQAAYLEIYRKFWSNINYRKVLCSLPAVLMWDDHDITDGWGSREDSFIGIEPEKKFKPEWRRLFRTARCAFRWMQAERNPPPISKNFKTGFDTCFRIGSAGFVIADLRSHRNVRKNRIWHPKQLEAIKNWVESNKNWIDDGEKKHLKTLFFVSTVVFSHGDPKIYRGVIKHWFRVLDLSNFFGRLKLFKRLNHWFSETFGDIRDDINDSWGSDVNREETDKVLDWLFSIQNPPKAEDAINVIILSGDIHTPGYSTLYSAHPDHRESAVIPHIVASPVSYKPFSWIGEAVFRHSTRTVDLGKKTVLLDGNDVQQYTAQVSHHFCYRNVVVVSLRNYEEDESFLKVKYYLEGYPEPQIMLFNLNKSSRREAVSWDKITAKQPLP